MNNKKIICQNKKAHHEYFLSDFIECGVVLKGTEIKSLRFHGASLVDSYVIFQKGEAYVLNMHIAPYEKGNIFNREPRRERKLLMHKREIMKINGMLTQKGYTLVPLSLYFSGKNVKVELGLCRGKKLYDKRDTAAKAEASREMDRRIREQSKYD